MSCPALKSMLRSARRLWFEVYPIYSSDSSPKNKVITFPFDSSHNTSLFHPLILNEFLSRPLHHSPRQLFCLHRELKTVCGRLKRDLYGGESFENTLNASTSLASCFESFLDGLERDESIYGVNKPSPKWHLKHLSLRQIATRLAF